MKSVLFTICLLAVIVSQDLPGQEQETGAFEKLDREFSKVWRDWRTKKSAAQRAKVGAEKLAAIDAEEPTRKYIPRFEGGAKKHAGTEKAFPYLRWLRGWGDRFDPKLSEWALDQLVKDHLEHPDIGRVAFGLALDVRRRGYDRTKALKIIDLIAKQAGTAEQRADTIYWRCYAIAGTKLSKAEKARMVKDLEEVIKSGNERMRGEARGLLFEMQHLQIGMKAPDIEGEDLDGVKFKLSDYQGKVIMLDFWGDW